MWWWDGWSVAAASGQGGAALCNPPDANRQTPKHRPHHRAKNQSHPTLFFASSRLVAIDQGYELDVGNAGIKHGGWEPAGNIGKAVMAAWQRERRYAGFEKVAQAAANAAAAKTGWAKLL